MSQRAATMPDMQTRTFYRWWITDPTTGRRRQTRHHMTEDQVRPRHPDAEPVQGSQDVRRLSDDPGANCTSAWLRGPILPQ